jgi:hypothetical protein
MTLPFDNTDKNTKKYQCFVCGVMFDNFDLYKTHIIDTHEEGREYIKCPLDYCQAPVRDVRLHFQARHPGQKCPKTGQLKSLIWKDFTPKGKKTRKPKFKDGWHESIKMNRKFYYRSGYELTVFKCLDVLPEIEAYIVEPFKIPYIWDGTVHEYTPDLIITFVDGHKELWEIKPSNQTLLEQNQCKWKAAAAACLTRGWKFEIYTETGINKLKRRVKLLQD